MIIRNATDNKLINVNGKSLAPDEWIEIEAENMTPGIKALVMQGALALSKKPVVTDESLELLKEAEKIQKEKAEEVKAEEAVKEEPEEVKEEPVKKTTPTRKKKAE